MAKRKLKECHSCKRKVHSLVTMKLSQVAVDLGTSRVMNFFPLCVSCVQRQVTNWTAQLLANGEAP